MIGLELGGITLQGFEIPGGIRFGGNQALAVHKLPGGARVVDAMGADDSDLAWSGVLTGSAAADRARALDLLRVSGSAIPLAWDAFLYTVVIRRLTMSFTNPWWIPYAIACTVVVDSSASAVSAILDEASAILGDLAVAAGFIDVAGASAAVGAPGALTPGTANYAAAGTALGAAEQGIAARIAGAETALGGADLAGLVSAAGTLAALTSAQGYVERAAANFALGTG